MKAKFIKSILIPTLGILSTGVITPLAMSSCGEVLVEGVTINELVSANPIELEANEEKDLVVSIYPENATNKNVVWESANENIVSIVKKDSKTVKLIAGPKTGDTTITATAKDGSGIKATCKVFVTRVDVDDILLNESELKLTVGKTGKLSATIIPANATIKSVIWKSSDSSIAMVDSNGLVTASKAGEATITVVAGDNTNIKATCKVVVTA